MSENNQNDEKIEISYSIYIKEFPEELIKILQEHNIKFQVWENQELIDKDYDLDEELTFVELDQELYNKLKMVSDLTGLPMEDMVNKEVEHLLYDVMADQPVAFLDEFFDNVSLLDFIERISENIKK